MITTSAPASPSSRPTASTTVAVLAAGIVASLLPVVFGAAFLVSVVIRRPLVAMLARRWPPLSGGPPVLRGSAARVWPHWQTAPLPTVAGGLARLPAGLTIRNDAGRGGPEHDQPPCD